MNPVAKKEADGAAKRSLKKNQKWKIKNGYSRSRGTSSKNLIRGLPSQALTSAVIRSGGGGARKMFESRKNPKPENCLREAWRRIPTVHCTPEDRLRSFYTGERRVVWTRGEKRGDFSKKGAFFTVSG